LGIVNDQYLGPRDIRQESTAFHLTSGRKLDIFQHAQSDRNLHAAVLGPAFCGVVAGHGVAFSVPHGGHAPGRFFPAAVAENVDADAITEIRYPFLFCRTLFHSILLTTPSSFFFGVFLRRVIGRSVFMPTFFSTWRNSTPTAKRKVVVGPTFCTTRLWPEFDSGSMYSHQF